MWRIKLAIPLTIAPVAVASSVLVGWHLHYQRSTLERELVSRAKWTATLLERDLEDQMRTLANVSTATILDDDLIDHARVTTALSRLLPQSPAWIALRLTSVQGLPVLDVPERVGSPQRPVVDVESHTRAILTKKPVIGGMMRGPMNRVNFAVRAPVIRDGQVKYVLSAVVEPSAVADVLVASAAPHDWLITVIDHTGHIAARSASASTHLGRLASETARASRDRKSLLPYEGTTVDGRSMISAYYPLEGGWSVHVGTPKASAPMDLKTYAMVVGPLVLGAILTAFWSIRDTLRQRQNEADELDAERGKAREKQDLLTNEVRHRTRNQWQKFQSIIERTVRGDRTLEEVRGILTKRLHIIANASEIHDGPAPPDTVRRLVIAGVSAFTDRFEIEGDDDLCVDGGLASDFAMLVHELCTNAVKHGALRADNGCIKVAVRPDLFAWREENGPPAKPPTRRGFGLALLETLGRAMGGRLVTRFEECGFSCELMLSHPQTSVSRQMAGTS